MSASQHTPDPDDPAARRPQTEAAVGPETRTLDFELDLIDEPELPDLFPPQPASQPDPSTRGKP